MSPKRLFIVLVVTSLVATSLFAGGYQINEHGARAVGMGGAFVARASDPSAIFFNAAGLAYQKGINFSVGTTLIFPSTEFTSSAPLPTTTTSMVSQTFYPTNIYGTYAINEKFVVGLGVFSPYGLGTEWPATWLGKAITVKSDIQTFYITPSVGYLVNDKLSVGLGLSYVIAKANLKNSNFALDGSGNSFTFNVGAIYKAMPNLSVGASYRHVANVDFEGDVTWPAVPSRNGTGKATLPMAGTLQVGAAYAVNPKLTVECDLQYTLWSDYKSLDLTLPVLGLVSSRKEWINTPALRLGGEYALNEKITLRAGYIRDQTPQPDHTLEPMLPDANRNDISLGGGYKINQKLTVDLAYMIVLFEDRTTTTNINHFNGTYKSSANLVSLSFGYSL
jgi:long-chain fatty acid transport protein